MNELKQWMMSKLAEKESKVPTFIHKDPASFAHGCNAGYKQCLQELGQIIRSVEEKN